MTGEGVPVPDPVTLSVAGDYHGGWTSVMVKRSLQLGSGTFSIALTDRWLAGHPGGHATGHPGSHAARPVRAGQACRLMLGDDVVITGWIDAAEPGLDAQQHTITIRGRDTTGDLVDCSARHESGEWKDQNLQQIIGDLVRPYGIDVHVRVDTGEPFRSFGINESETVFEAMDRACRMRAILPLSDGKGGLVLTRAEQATRISATLRTGPGGNVLSGSGGTSLIDRFSTITVKGQTAGNDWSDAEDHTSPVAVAKDDNVTRHRPLVILAEDQADTATLKNRARWEASVRRARSMKAVVAVQGWRNDSGDLWQPLTMVSCKMPELGIAGDRLISSVTWSLDDKRGSRTELEMAPPGAFELIPLAGDEDGEEVW